jgi:hypothetical protein
MMTAILNFSVKNKQELNEHLLEEPSAGIVGPSDQ